MYKSIICHREPTIWAVLKDKVISVTVCNFPQRLDAGQRRSSWDHLDAPGFKAHRHNSAHNLSCGDDAMSAIDVHDLTLFVSSFTEALYKLKDLFSSKGTEGDFAIIEI